MNNTISPPSPSYPGLELMLDSLMDLFSDLRPTWHEARFQADIRERLIDAGIGHTRELPCEHGTVDFAVAAGRNQLIAIEAKTQGSLAPANRQLVRYLEDERFVAGMLVTTRSWKLGASEAGGKPIRLVSVWRNGL